MTGAWSEREEDLTGSYAYLGNKWLAFDDDTSLKIKVGYLSIIAQFTIYQ